MTVIPSPVRPTASTVPSTLRRNAELDWLKAPFHPGENVCRIPSNARCLSEGVDVPALDAVLVFNPRDSVVDVQSVGRVMRPAVGKDYGYIILPIGVPGRRAAWAGAGGQQEVPGGLAGATRAART